ncbi:DUF1178 family protein [Noviherbaspirillum saxi]|uniref:DUF1178 family protein n=1 Tax=Noviherbaspirillum saxi TaxID=2320863 RepID=A0A3A3FXC2_9BURK|nr:DUF1178 family protein [Noviherbaspirillum saxi]RJG00025.1 DUF1178 family protein [Noviherbaspirillum saxi]
MKVYNLCCESNHRFEGWFASEQDFHQQVEDGFLACPICDSHAISRMPSAPRLNISGAQAPAQTPIDSVLQTQLMELVRKVVENTEDVGERFAEEARRIHYNETPERAIRGVASADEFKALSEEGIDVVPLPVPVSPKESVH